MVARFWCLTFLIGCYDLPKPECGFACGPAGACPSSYSCNSAVNRCELDGSTPTCEAAFDAGVRSDAQTDFNAPMLISQGPPPNSVDVGLAVQIHAQFDEPVFGYTSSTFRVEHFGVEEIGPVMYDPASFTVFRQFPDLLPDTDYTVTVTSGITDAAGNGAFAAWTFHTIDTQRPTVTLRIPAEGSVGVGVGADIFADFSEDVTGVSAGSFTVTQSGMPVSGTVSYTPFGSRATFTQTTQLAANTTYTMNLSSAIQDTATTPNSLMPVTWMFTTGPDQQIPAVQGRSPINGATDVPVIMPVSARFDEQVINVTTTSFTLTPQGGGPVAASIRYTAATRTAMLTPALQLDPQTLYIATLTSAITDAVNNPLTQLVWMFTTGADDIGPRVALTAPADVATAVPTSSTIVVQFDEPVLNVTTTTFTVNGSAIPGTIALSAGNTVATFTPDAALPASATITVDVTTAVTDARANPLAAPVMFSFMTAP